MHEETRFSLFPSPTAVFSSVLTETDREAVLQWVLAERERHRGITRSNIGGWHSLADIVQRPAPALQPLWRAAVAAVGQHHAALMAPGSDASRLQFNIQAWAMVMESGDYTVPHDHVEATWSAVYWVDAGEHPEAHPSSGSLTLCSPIGGRSGVSGLPTLQSTFTIQPQSNTLVIFPGWLQHYVHPYQGQRPRVTIAFNTRVGLRS